MRIVLKQMVPSMDPSIFDDVPDCDLLVLPEMWNCPYHNEVLQEAYKLHDQALDILKNVSKTKNIDIIAGSICAKEKEHIYNRCYILHNGEIVTHYDKTHLFTFKTYSEADVFTAGNHFVTFQDLGILLCYDIRFPEMSRLLALHGAKILICPAAFNEAATKKHWELFCRTRALENEVFVCGCAPAKYQYKSYISGGHSLIVDPFGDIVDALDEDEGYLVYDLDLNKINQAREKMPFWKIRRNDLYTLGENYERNKNQ